MSFPCRKHGWSYGFRSSLPEGLQCMESGNCFQLLAPHWDMGIAVLALCQQKWHWIGQSRKTNIALSGKSQNGWNFHREPFGHNILKPGACSLASCPVGEQRSKVSEALSTDSCHEPHTEVPEANAGVGLLESWSPSSFSLGESGHFLAVVFWAVMLAAAGTWSWETVLGWGVTLVLIQKGRWGGC